MKRSFECVSALVVAGVVMMAAGSASAQQIRWRASARFTASHSTTIRDGDVQVRGVAR